MDRVVRQPPFCSGQLHARRHDRSLQPPGARLTAAAPRTRGECGEVRPCPWVTCRYHLFVDIVPTTGQVRMPHGRDVEDMRAMTETCALDVAARGPLSLHEAAVHFGLTPERIRQEESAALRKLRQPTNALTAYKDIG